MSTTTVIVVVTILCCLNGNILAVSVDGSAWIDALKQARSHRESALSQSEYDVDNSEPNPGQAEGETKREEWMRSFGDKGSPNYVDEPNFYGDTQITANLQKKADTSPEVEVKQLKAQLEEQKKAIEKQKTEMESMMQQIDALVVQQSKTLSLVNNKGKSNSGPQIGLQVAKESVLAEVITTGGVTYVRWGRYSCPPEVLELYRGSVAGSHYTATSGGSNTLCLHDDPQFGTSGNSGSGNYIYGAEYQYNTPFSTANNNGQTLGSQDVPCVVCHTPIRSSQIMIPGRIQCPAGWTFEYKGYLVSSFGGYSRSDYICLDEAPEAKVGGQSALYGLLLHPVRAQCGSLSCPKYINGADVVCVVCTK